MKLKFGKEGKKVRNPVIYLEKKNPDGIFCLIENAYILKES